MSVVLLLDCLTISQFLTVLSVERVNVMHETLETVLSGIKREKEIVCFAQISPVTKSSSF